MSPAEDLLVVESTSVLKLSPVVLLTVSLPHKFIEPLSPSLHSKPVRTSLLFFPLPSFLSHYILLRTDIRGSADDVSYRASRRQLVDTLWFECRQGSCRPLEWRKIVLHKLVQPKTKKKKKFTDSFLQKDLIALSAV